MKKNVFISHASADIEIAQIVCEILEDNNITCWFAPRDIPPGTAFNEEIIKAIRYSIIFVLILTSKSNLSDHVKRELERATNYKLPIFTIRAQNIRPSAGIEFFLSLAQWIDFFDKNDTKPILIAADNIKAKMAGIVDSKKISSPTHFKLNFNKEINVGKINTDCIAISNDFKKISIASSSEFRVLDFETLTVLNKNLFGHANYITAMAFSKNDNNHLITVAEDRIVLWNLIEEEIVSVIPREVGSTYRGLRINNDSELLLEYSWHSEQNQYTQVFDISLENAIAKFEGIKANCGDFHPSNDYVVCGFWNGEIKAFSLKEKQQINTKFMTEANHIKIIRFTPCGNYFITYADNWGGEDIKIWDCTKWKCIDRIKLRNKCNRVHHIQFDNANQQLMIFQDKLVSFYYY